MSFGFRIKSRKVIRCVGWWLVVHLDYSVNSGPFLTMNFKFDQDHGSRPGLELDTIYITFQMTCQLEFHVNISHSVCEMKESYNRPFFKC